MTTFEKYLEQAQINYDLNTWSREALLNLCQQNDPHGFWADAKAKAEGMDPVTKEEALSKLREWMKDGDYESEKDFIKAIKGIKI